MVESVLILVVEPVARPETAEGYGSPKDVETAETTVGVDIVAMSAR